ncbi:L,D-transpeptidase, partial [Clostridioides difficile]|uniref:L,D-transpeptidase n=1 Tax=Clostridioides difficile TaxID=1496 RepID=UPI0018DDDE7E
RLPALDGVRYLVRANEVTRLDVLKAAPEKVAPDEVWIDVDIVKQTLVLYRGLTPLFTTLVSSGAGGKGRITPTGVFRVYQKHTTARMSADE